MKHNFFFLFISFIYIYHFYFKIMSHPPRTTLTSRSSTRSQPSSPEHDSTEQLRALLTRSRNRRAAILARRRASGQKRSGNGTQGTTLSTHEHQPVTWTTALSAIASAVLTISTLTLMLTLSSKIPSHATSSPQTHNER